MKYTILIFFLIAFANLKKPNFGLESFLTQTKQVFFSESGKQTKKDDPDEDSDEYRCENEGTDKDVCPNIELNDNKNYQCCFVKSITEGGTTEKCELSPYPAKYLENVANSPQFGPMIKEFAGFSVYSSMNKEEDKEEALNNLKNKAEITCKDANLNLSIGYDEYTEEDKKTLESENHCLYYLYDTFNSQFMKKHTCKKGQILKSSKEAGIECGNLEVDMKYQGTSFKIESCFLFSYDFYKQISLNEGLKKLIQDRTGDYFGQLERFKVTLSDGNGNNKVSFVLSSSYFLMISKYLLLLCLFLF